MQRPVSWPKSRGGFTLVELAVVIVIIGVLAAFGVPKFLASVEKIEGDRGVQLSGPRFNRPQERYLAQNGVYATIADATAPASSTGNPLDIVLPKLQYFDLRGHQRHI